MQLYSADCCYLLAAYKSYTNYIHRTSACGDVAIIAQKNLASFLPSGF